VTPSFNQGAFIEETILSVLNQGYPDVEHIVVDGGSTDGTLDVLDRYRDRLAVCRSEPDRGQSHALNKGLALVTGEIVTWLNSDDMLAPGALGAIALAFERSGADMVAGICEIHSAGRVFHRHLTSCRDGLLPLEDLLDLEGRWLNGQFFYQPEVFFRRAIWEHAGGFVDGALHYSMDYDLWVRFALAGAQLHVIGRPIALYRAHEQQKTALAERYRPELERVRARYRTRHPAAAPRPALARVEARLRISMVNDVGFRYGAGIAHGRIARALALAGHEVLPIAVSRDNLAMDDDDGSRAARLLKRLREEEPDLVVVGNLHGARLDPEVLRELSRSFPTVFVLHDEWMLTGRCAYRDGCEQHRSPGGCDASCPTASEYPPLAPDRIGDAWRTKRALRAAGSPLTLVGNSRWMAAELVSASRGARAGDPLHYGLPLDVFKPRDATLCRELLGLPQDRFIVLFSATGMADPRKGLALLVDALERAHLPNALPVAVGWASPSDREKLPGVHFTGYVEDDATRAMVYSAADVMAVPSLEEAFGQVLIEAAACGTPSVAFAVGGIPEALADGVTGRLVRTVSAKALAGALEELYRDPLLRRNLGAWGRLHVESAFSFERSYHHVFAAIQAALEHHGTALSPKICFAPGAPWPAAVEYLVETRSGRGTTNGESHLPFGNGPRSQLGLEAEMLRYFTDRLAHYRAGAVPWYLSPRAWLARINRQSMKKLVARRSLR
jgi:glycosyltransferase involved in cell wall biosynthesis